MQILLYAEKIMHHLAPSSTHLLVPFPPPQITLGRLSCTVCRLGAVEEIMHHPIATHPNIILGGGCAMMDTMCDNGMRDKMD